METGNRWALKEWAVVCAALAAGRQALLLRKGGLAEGPHGFQVEHPEFWLLPTRFHQSADELRPEAAPLLTAAASLTPPPGRLEFPLYARVAAFARLEREDELAPLMPLQILSTDTVSSRFHYRRPGLVALLLRVHRPSTPAAVSDRPEYAGCHSWVELNTPLRAGSLTPVLDDERFQSVVAAVAEACPRLLLPPDPPT